MALAPASEIVAALRDYSLTVVERPHWRILGTGYPFRPFAQVFHHDAFTEAVSDARALQVMEDGRPDLRGPLCNGWIDSSSVVYLIAYGNANHAGRNEADVLDRLRQGLAPLGDARADSDGDTVIGNSHLWGWECRNAGTGHDPWEQLDAMERAGAALADACGWPTQAIAAHRELTARKIDVAGIDMDQFRADVARIKPQEDDMTPEQDAKLEALFSRIGTIDSTASAVEQLWARRGLIDSLAGLRADDVDEAEVARQVLAGIGDAALSDEQVRAIIDAMPAAVKQALREGTG